MQLSCAKLYVRITSKNGKRNYVRIKISEFCHVISKITDHENEAKKSSRF